MSRRILYASLWLCLSMVFFLPGCPAVPDVEPGAVLLVTSKTQDPALERLWKPLQTYVEKLTGNKPIALKIANGKADQIVALAKAAGAGLVLVLEGENIGEDKGRISDLKGESFRLLSYDEGDWNNSLGSKGATFVYALGATKLSKQYAVYEFLRRLGARFYHPEQEYLPKNPPSVLRERAKTSTVVAPKKGNVYVPDFPSDRSFSFHGSHPLEHQEAFSDSQHPIKEAVHVNDWIVKNRGNRFRGAGRGVATGDQRTKRVNELNALRKVMGFPTGAGISLHNQQQGSSAIVDRNSSVSPKKQIEDYVTQRLKDNPNATSFGIHFGPTEFTVTPDKETVDWINWAGRKALELIPGIEVVVNNHTSGSQPSPNFDDLGCSNDTNANKRIDYYDLSFHSDKRFMVKVHTVMFYPLEGPAYVYNQKTFSHKLCLMKKASAQGRPLLYFPEGSWWLSFDNPIPVYLPLYIWTRGRDIELIKPLLKSRGKGTLTGHRMFNSGHEWGYWQQDYAVGLWHWNADLSMEKVIGEMMDPFCEPKDWKKGCKARTDAIQWMMEYMKHQAKVFLTDKDWKGLPGGLYPYFAGEDPADEIAAVTGFEFRPVKVAYRTVLSWNSKQLEHFRKTDLKALKDIDTKHVAWLKKWKSLLDVIPEAGKVWLTEIIDGIEINLLRARQNHALYEAVLVYRETQLANEEKQKKDPKAELDDPKKKAESFWKLAVETLNAAEGVIRRREKSYRYPAAQTHGGGVTKDTAVPNGTTYPWRVHTKTHLLTYWKNRHQQVKEILDGAAAAAKTLVLQPVFGAPGDALTVVWPKVDDLKASVKLGDKELKTTTTRVELGKDEGFWSVKGQLELAGRLIQLKGGVVRAKIRAATAKGGFKLLKPDSSLAAGVLKSLFPPMLLAKIGTPDNALVFAPDLDGDGKAAFADVYFTPFAGGDDSGFATKPISFVLPVPDPATRAVALNLGIEGLVFKGSIKDGKLVSPIRMEGALSVNDLVEALIKLAGFDRKGALQTLGEVLQFNPSNPPSKSSFVAEVALKK